MTESRKYGGQFALSPKTKQFPPPAPKKRDPETGKWKESGGKSKEKRKRWSNRWVVNLSPNAYLCLLKVQKLMYDLQIPVIPSSSTAIEFLLAVAQAYHDKTRLDVLSWRPTTMYIKPKKVSDDVFTVKDQEFLSQKIEELENEQRAARERHDSQRRRALQLANERRREEAIRSKKRK